MGMSLSLYIEPNEREDDERYIVMLSYVNLLVIDRFHMKTSFSKIEN